MIDFSGNFWEPISPFKKVFLGVSEIHSDQLNGDSDSLNEDFGKTNGESSPRFFSLIIVALIFGRSSLNDVDVDEVKGSGEHVKKVRKFGEISSFFSWF